MGSSDLNNSSSASFTPFKAQNYSNQCLSPPAVGLSPHSGACWPSTARTQPTHPAGMS